MKIEEYDALERVEREHWFYKGKRQLVRYWIERAGRLTPGDCLTDCGAGTGELVRELDEAYRAQRISVIGIEFVEEARRLALERKGIHLQPGSILDLPQDNNSNQVTIALDVIEHVENDALAFSEMLRVTAPGGIVIINVPASMKLWSDWDVSLGHFRRYSKQSFLALLAPYRNQFDPLHLDYANAVAFLPILALRNVSRWFHLKTRFEDRVPSSRWNTLLLSIFVQTSRTDWFHPPFGSSIFCVLRKR